jgi:hypothetical protein
MAVIDFTTAFRAALAETASDWCTLLRAAVREELAQHVGHDPDELLTAEAAAKLLGLTPAALRRASERGRAPVKPLHLGRRLRWRRGDLVALVRERGQ